MKNQIFSSSFFVFFLIANTVLYGQSNQATKFELTNTNANSIATQVYQLLVNNAQSLGYPTIPVLQAFFENPFNTPNVIYNQSSCAQPEVRVYRDNTGQICFRFDNIVNSQNGNLVIGNLDYTTSAFNTAYVIHGNGLNTGIDLPLQSVHCQVFVIGYLCPPTTAGGPQLANKFEILIVDKIIL